MIAGCAGFIVLGVALVVYSDWLGILAGLVAVAFFGVCMLIATWRLFTLRGPVVTMTRDGFQDTRLSRERVAWREIEEISTWQFGGQKQMLLRISDDTWDRIGVSAIAARTRGFNRSFGGDGLAVSATELQISHDALLLKTAELWHDATRKRI